MRITAIICATLIALCTMGHPDLLDIAIVRLSYYVPLCEKPVPPVEGVVLE